MAFTPPPSQFLFATYISYFNLPSGSGGGGVKPYKVVALNEDDAITKAKSRLRDELGSDYELREATAHLYLREAIHIT